MGLYDLDLTIRSHEHSIMAFTTALSLSPARRKSVLLEFGLCAKLINFGLDNEFLTAISVPAQNLIVIEPFELTFVFLFFIFK
jgi:hypothetical protein